MCKWLTSAWRETEHDIETGDGLFLRAFSQLMFVVDPKLQEIHKRLPNNAKYTSSDVQNEIILILAKLVKNKVADDTQEAKLFTILADGTTHKNQREVQGLVCRYFSQTGKNEEHCLNIMGVEDRTAKGIFQFIKSTLAGYDLSVDGLVSQSYDGL